ncbi:MAG TPA: hypothetical protein VMS11_12360 [Solirubrobacterales bacterium]|nr:hypothetical protein [Solirubrobacterales bacterium]
MNFLKKGPELKLSALKEIKVPGFIQDVYFDLKDRHLLPIAVILLVALFAVPIALSQSSSEAEEPAASEAGASASVSVSGAETRSGELVAKAAPGLRDYRRRLNHLRAKDPFIQQYTGSGEGSGTVESSSESSASGGTEEGTSSESFSPESSYTPTESPSGGEGGEPNQSGLRYYSYAIDVKVSAGGSAEAGGKDGEPAVRRNLPELTMLPSRETPALVYMGSTKDGKKALFVVSSDVDSVFGDAKCVLGSTSCQMIAMEPGLPETLVYGGSNKTYKIELLKIHLVETKDLNRAPLGKPKSKDSGEAKPHPHGQRLAVGAEVGVPGP